MKSSVAIIGGGPAGASLAIRLAADGYRVILVDRDRFPRHKLCGEFISPECLRHFRSLGVYDRIISAGGDSIAETRFFSMQGRSVSFPTRCFGESEAAISLSRSEMDLALIEMARDRGADVIQGSRAVAANVDARKMESVVVRAADGVEKEISADIFVDAAGRAGVLSMLLAKTDHSRAQERSAEKPQYLGFKARVRNAGIEKGICEIYSLPGGYGGLCNVENGVANHCFLITANAARRFGADTDSLVGSVVLKNPRAAAVLSASTVADGWLAVSFSRFGARRDKNASNVLTVGDATAFMDPFTGSGILTALETSEMLAGCFGAEKAVEDIGGNYRARYKRRFARRLRVGSLIRYAAFSPALAGLAIAGFGTSELLRSIAARSTRHRARPMLSHRLRQDPWKR